MAKIPLKQVLANIYSEWPSTTKEYLADKKLRIYIQFYICGYTLVNFIKKFTIWKNISKFGNFGSFFSSGKILCR
jgi:hypothetical protein